MGALQVAHEKEMSGSTSRQSTIFSRQPAAMYSSRTGTYGAYRPRPRPPLCVRAAPPAVELAWPKAVPVALAASRHTPPALRG
eukprot:6566051-Prymnesium_polylepis.1